MSARMRLSTVTLLAAMSAATPVAGQRQTLASVAALQRWVEAVNQHAPGHPDASVQFVTGLSYGNRVDLHTSYSLFIRALRGELVATRSDIDTMVTVRARTVRMNPGAATFLKRAAVLHSDALVFASRFPALLDDAPPPPPRGAHSGVARGAASPPLLYNEVVTLTRDGEVYGDAKGDWNLPFARSLLDVLLRLSPASRAESGFVGEWYHATTAFLFANGNYADATSHLDHAARVLPDDPNVLSDRGAYAEAFGLPIYQVLLDDPAHGRRGGFTTGIPDERKTNGDAERAYRRALAVDPSYVEARVRLARLLEHRGQHAEASAEIATALAAAPTGVTGFYASLVAGRIASTRGRYDDALGHYRAALALYPQAQSALLGASHAALMLADTRETLRPLQELPGRASTSAEDPWWAYQVGAGRDVNDLLHALWGKLSK